MEVRTADINDLGGIMKLYSELNPDDDNIADNTALESVWRDIMGKDSIRYFVMEQGEQIVSTCNIAVIPNLSRGARPFSVIENVVTRHDYRNRGCGAKVVNAAVDFARACGCYKVMLLSSSGRKAAHAFYEKLGFNSTDKIGFFMYL